MPSLLVPLGQRGLREYCFSRLCAYAGCSLFPTLATADTFWGPVTGRVLSFFLLPGGIASFEYLFLFCVSAALLPALLLRRGKPLDWWLAGGIGCLAVLTRSTGILLSIPFLIVYMRRFWFTAERKQYRWFQQVNAFAPIVLIPAALLAYTIYLGYTTGNPFIIQAEEAAGWHRHFAWIWTTYHQTLKILFAFPPLSLDFAKDLLDIAFTTLPIVALLISWKRLPLHYSLFALAAFILSISFPLGTINPMASQPRYMMSIFPFIVVFAFWGKRPHFDWLFIALGPPLLALNCILFISHYWVA